MVRSAAPVLVLAAFLMWTEARSPTVRAPRPAQRLVGSVPAAPRAPVARVPVGGGCVTRAEQVASSVPRPNDVRDLLALGYELGEIVRHVESHPRTASIKSRVNVLTLAGTPAQVHEAERILTALRRTEVHRHVVGLALGDRTEERLGIEHLREVVEQTVAEVTVARIDDGDLVVGATPDGHALLARFLDDLRACAAWPPLP